MTPPGPNRPEWKAILRLAAPIALAQVGQVLTGIVDIKIVGKLGAAAIAAAAAGHGVAIIVSLFIMGMAMGLDPIVAQRLGARDEDGAWHAFGDCLRVTLVVAGPAIAAVVLVEWIVPRARTSGGHPLPVWFPMDRDVAEQAIAYTWARLPGVVPFMLFGAYRAWFYANHMTRPMICGDDRGRTWRTRSSTTCSCTATKGSGGSACRPSASAPGGVAAAGAVTSAVNVLSIVYLAPIAFKRRRALLDARLSDPLRASAADPAFAHRIPRDRDAPDPAARVAHRHRHPARGRHLRRRRVAHRRLRHDSTGRAGDRPQDREPDVHGDRRVRGGGFRARRDARSALGRRLQRGGRASRRSCCRSSGWRSAATSLVLFPRELAGLFADDPAVIDAAAPLLRVAALFQVFDGTQSAISGALRGAGDTRLPMLANLVAYWAVGLPVAEVLAFRAGMGPVGLWVGLTAGLVVVAILLTWRFHSLTRRDVARVA